MSGEVYLDNLVAKPGLLILGGLPWESNWDIYRPQRSWGRVIFSQASVILSTGGRAPGQVPPQDHVHPPGTRYPPQDQVTPRPGTPPRTRYTPRDQVQPPRSSACQEIDQQTGGTHPTGMHSCLVFLAQ